MEGMKEVDTWEPLLKMVNAMGKKCQNVSANYSAVALWWYDFRC